MVAPAYDHSTLEAEIGGSLLVPGLPGLQIEFKATLNNKVRLCLKATAKHAGHCGTHNILVFGGLKQDCCNLKPAWTTKDPISSKHTQTTNHTQRCTNKNHLKVGVQTPCGEKQEK